MTAPTTLTQTGFDPRLLSGFVDTMPFLFFALNRERRIVSLNTWAQNLLGYHDAELTEQEFLSAFVHKTHKPRFAGFFSSLERDHSSCFEESKIVTKGGNTLYVTWHGRRLNGNPENPDGYSLIGIDLTKQVKERRQQQAEKSSYVRLFEHAPEAIVLCSNEGTLLRMNREFTQIFGHLPEDALGQCLDDLIAPPDRKTEASQITKQVASGEKVSCETVRQKKKR